MDHFRLFITILILLSACDKRSGQGQQNAELIGDFERQDSIFSSLRPLIKNWIPSDRLDDSLAFLILPVQASCPSCRRKTIRSILKSKTSLPKDHFIIISADGGRKTISAFFREQQGEIPVMPGQLFLDTVNKALELDLYDKKPTFYYSHNRRVYKMASAIPSTIQYDLQAFFLK